MSEEWFKPDKFKKLNWRYFLITLAVLGLPFAVPAAFMGGVFAVICFSVLALAVLAYKWYLPKLYDVVGYRLGEEDIQHVTGVWFRNQTSVPYERITHVDTNQGPVQRMVGAGSVHIQTAGSSAQTGAELVINGLSNYDEVKEKIREKVRRHKNGSGTVENQEQEVSESSEVVKELKKIRRLLEEQG